MLFDDEAFLGASESFLAELLAGEVEIDGGVSGFAVDTRLEMQMGCRSPSRLSCQGYSLPRLDLLALLDKIFGVMRLIGFQAVGMFDSHEVTIA